MEWVLNTHLDPFTTGALRGTIKDSELTQVTQVTQVTGQ